MEKTKRTVYKYIPLPFPAIKLSKLEVRFTNLDITFASPSYVDITQG